MAPVVRGKKFAYTTKGRKAAAKYSAAKPKKKKI